MKTRIEQEREWCNYLADIAQDESQTKTLRQAATYAAGCITSLWALANDWPHMEELLGEIFEITINFPENYERDIADSK